ncbi:MAG: PAS domain S-box protein [Chitinophagaceae bacterium]|nr:MAG: PAS domain S-box protein [Chitinophagaceae bacterium]
MPLKLLPTTNEDGKTRNNNGNPGKPITEIITNGFFTVDRKWTVKYWNKAAEVILGVQAKNILGKNLWEEFSGTLPLDFYNIYHKAFGQEIPVHFEEYWGEMGAWFDVVTYNCNDTLSVSFKSSNHSARPKNPEHTAEQLKNLNELYRFVTEVTNDCLWEWDLKAKELFWIDGGHKRVFGYQIVNALIPQGFWESRLHPDDKVRILTRLNKIIAEGSVNVWEDEYRFKRANGDYAYVHDRGHIIYEGDEKAARMIGATQDITKRVLLENKLAEERVTRQKEITNAVLTAQEKERADIGKELHDNLNQILAVTKLYIQMAKTYEKDREMYLEKSCDLVEGVIEEIRRIAKNLVVPDIHILGLFDNIKNLLNDLMVIHPIKIEFQDGGLKEEYLDEKLQLNILRIVQEQIINILKHSKATLASINLSMYDDKIILLISDNGASCDLLKEINGVGIMNIKSRTELYDGNVTILSKPGGGYKLKVVLPFNSHINKPEISGELQKI